MLLPTLLLVSCIFDRQECLVEKPFADSRIMFRVEVQDPEASRADWGESDPTDQIGNLFENRVLPGELRVAVYTPQNELLGNIQELVWWPTNDQNTEYQFMGSMPEALVNHILQLGAGQTPEYKFMVFANCPDGVDQEIYYDFHEINTDTGAIPMWGVSQVDLSELIANGVQDIGTIWLLRSIAKIEVVTDNPDCHIEQVSINHHNRFGYCLPEGWDTITSTTLLDREYCYRGYRSLHSGAHLLTEQREGKQFIMYIPEYDNKLFPEYEAKLSVRLSYGSGDDVQQLEYTDALLFKNYVDGAPAGGSHNIIRNTIYRFNIKDVKLSGLVLNYEVADWTVAEGGKWNQHFDYPTYHNPVLPDGSSRDGDATNDNYPERPEMTYTSPNSQEQIKTEQGAFSCWFQILGPEAQTWIPTVRQGSNRCVVRVYKEHDGGALELVYSTETDAEPSIASGDKLIAYSGWYNIKIIPTDPDYSGYVSFGITYTQDWMMGGARYLLINGEVDHIIWPGSGNEPRLLNVYQVTD